MNKDFRINHPALFLIFIVTFVVNPPQSITATPTGLSRRRRDFL
jgi:hypothetical protein